MPEASTQSITHLNLVLNYQLWVILPEQRSVGQNDLWRSLPTPNNLVVLLIPSYSRTFWEKESPVRRKIRNLSGGTQVNVKSKSKLLLVQYFICLKKWEHFYDCVIASSFLIYFLHTPFMCTSPFKNSNL